MLLFLGYFFILFGFLVSVMGVSWRLLGILLLGGDRLCCSFLGLRFGFIDWLHLDDEMASFDRDIVWVEDTGASVKATRGLVPSLLIKGIKVIPPQQVELVVDCIIGEDLNVVVQKEPWHVLGVEL